MSAMKLSEGIEWTAHACVALAALPEGKGLSAVALAELHDLPPAYMAKHMQALSRAGIVESMRGPKGGYRLAKPATEITMLDITLAIEGKEPAFRCSEIRQRGPCKAECKPTELCGIAAAFLAAERVYREALGGVILADIVMDTMASFTPDRIATFTDWVTSKT